MPEHEQPARPSKSERKRMHQRIQSLAGELAELPAREINKLPVDEVAREELLLASRMTPSGARVRQLKHVAHLLETEDISALQDLLERRNKPGREAAARQRSLERTRAELITGGEAQELKVLQSCPTLSAQKLRSMCRDARAEQSTGHPRGAGRALFRLLSEELS